MTDPLLDLLTEALEASEDTFASSDAEVRLMSTRAAARVAADTVRRLPPGPWLAVMRIPGFSEDDAQRLGLLGEMLREQAGCLTLLGLDDGVELTALDDDDLARLGLMRVTRGAIRDTPDTRVDEMSDAPGQPE